MPYLRDGACVYKKNPDGSRGEELHCFDTDDEAQQYYEALMTNVEDAHKADGSMVVQSVLVSKETAKTQEEAAKLVRDLGFEATKVDEKENTWRFRQRDPGEFDPESFRTKEIKPGVQLVLGKLKPTQKAETAQWVCGAARHLDVIDDRGWDGAAAATAIIVWAGGKDDFNPAKAKRGFLAYDAANEGNLTAYKLPFCIVKEGKLVASRSGLAAAHVRLSHTDISDEAKRVATAVITHYQGQLEKQRQQEKAVTVKALDESGRIGGYLVVWGDAQHRDLQNEYFTKATDLGLDWYPRRPVLYHHGLDGELGPTMIGSLEAFKATDLGVWVEGQLDLRNRWARAVLDLVQKGALGWSSGSLPHLVEVTAEGEIKRWPIIEGSLTPSPAEPRQTDAVARKHLDTVSHAVEAYKSAGIDLPDLLTPEPVTEDGPDRGQGGAGTPASAGKTTSVTTVTRTEDTTMAMTEEAILALIDKRDAQKAETQRLAEQKAKADQAEALEAKVKDLEAKLADPAAPARRLPGDTRDPELPAQDHPQPHITVGSKYDNLSAIDMAWGVEVLRAAHMTRPDWGKVSEQYANALAAKVWDAGYRPVRPDGTAYKGTDLMQSTYGNYGDEWVPDLWSAEVWRKARVDNVILPLFRQIEMPSNPFELSAEGTDPTVYYVPETSAETELTIAGSGAVIPDSKIGSAKIQLSAKKLALRVGFSAELTEDAIVPVLAMYREQAMRSMADAIDNALLNGDTDMTINTNINLHNGTPGGTEKYLAFNGLRQLPLITTPAQKVDASGAAPSLSLMRQTRFTFPARYALRARDLAWIVDGATYGKILGLDEIVTLDKFGPQATVLTGEIGKVDGMPVLASAEMGLTMADGKIDSTSNTMGQAVCVYRPGWIVGYRRQIATAAVYIPYYDAYQLVATVRVAFNRFDAYASACLYDIGV